MLRVLSINTCSEWCRKKYADAIAGNEFENLLRPNILGTNAYLFYCVKISCCFGLYAAAAGIVSIFFSFRIFILYDSASWNEKNTAISAVHEALEAVNLSSYANQKIRTFSGGMKQRLLFAQAIVANPKVLVLDEPTAGLDPYQRIEIRNLIAGMAIDRIILIATHVVQDIDVIAKEILLLKDGKLVGKGSSSELRKI